MAATNQAGIHIFGIFIPDDIASLSTMMPLNFIAELKGMFQGAFECSLFTSLKSVHDCYAEILFKHDCGSYASSVGRTVTFLRVKDPLDVVPKPGIVLQEASLLEHLPCCASGQLRLLFSVEKSGSSTKLVL